MTLPIMAFPIAKALKLTVKEVVNDPDKQTMVLKHIVDNYPTSAALGFMDLSAEAEAFGSAVRFMNSDVPTITGSIVKTTKDVEELSVPNPLIGRTGIYVEGIRKAKANIMTKPVFASTIGPFSLAGRLMDMTEIMVNCYVNPSIVESTLKKTTAFIINYIKAFRQAGADGVLIAEPAAGLLSPDLCHRFSTEYIQMIKKAVCDDAFVFGYHNCGNVLSIAEEMVAIGADIYHFGDAIDIESMLRVIPEESLVMGNIKPSIFIYESLSDEIYDATLSLLTSCNKYKNFVISTGCDIPYDASLKNINAFFSGISDFYQIDKV